MTDHQICVENLISFDNTLIVRNFRIIEQRLEALARVPEKLKNLEDGLRDLEDWRTETSKQVSKLQTTGEMNYIEVKNLMRNQSKRRQSMADPSTFRVSGFLGADPNSLLGLLNSDQFTDKLRQKVQAILKEEELEQVKVRISNLSNLQARNNQKIEQLNRAILTTKGQLLEMQKIQVTQIQFSKFRTIEQQNRQVSTKINDRITELETQFAEIAQNNYTEAISNLQDSLNKRIDTLQIYIKKKAEQTDLLKLEEMLLGMIEHVTCDINQKLPNKTETKKALIYLEKRVNRLFLQKLGEEVQQGDPLLTAKTWCLSCKTQNKKTLTAKTTNPSIPLQQTMPRVQRSPSSLKKTVKIVLDSKQNSGMINTMASTANLSAQRPKIQSNIMYQYGSVLQQPLRVHYQYNTLFRGGIREYLNYKQEGS